MERRSAWAVGGTVFAGVLMMVNGVFGVLAGISGILHDDVFGDVGEYAYGFNLTTWGWIHLAIGALVLAAGIGLMFGAMWARVVGVVVTSLLVIAHFMWVPYHPLWALVSIAIGVFIIWALCSTRTRPAPSR